jgi:hypothetical protein
MLLCSAVHDSPSLIVRGLRNSGYLQSAESDRGMGARGLWEGIGKSQGMPEHEERGAVDIACQINRLMR